MSNNANTACSISKLPPITAKKVTFRRAESSSEAENAPPAPRLRYSGFPSLIEQRPPIQRQETSDSELSESDQVNKSSSVVPRNVKEVSPALSVSSSDEYWWDNIQERYRNRPLARSTPIEQDLFNETYDSLPAQNRLPVIEENTDVSSTESDIIEPTSLVIKPSDTFPPGIFDPECIKTPDQLVKIRLVNESITHKNDNLLHFISADCEFTNPETALNLYQDTFNTHTDMVNAARTGNFYPELITVNKLLTSY